jgi:hypothetical protein
MAFVQIPSVVLRAWKDLILAEAGITTMMVQYSSRNTIGFEIREVVAKDDRGTTARRIPLHSARLFTTCKDT